MRASFMNRLGASFVLCALFATIGTGAAVKTQNIRSERYLGFVESECRKDMEEKALPPIGGHQKQLIPPTSSSSPDQGGDRSEKTRVVGPFRLSDFKVPRGHYKAHLMKYREIEFCLLDTEYSSGEEKWYDTNGRPRLLLSEVPFVTYDDNADPPRTKVSIHLVGCAPEKRACGDAPAKMAPSRTRSVTIEIRYTHEYRRRPTPKPGELLIVEVRETCKLSWSTDGDITVTPKDVWLIPIE
jgi:hypothetical protein